MKVSRYIVFALACMLFHTAFYSSFAQPGFQVDIKKPAPYEERQLKAEKTGEGKLKTPKRIFQNLTTRYNYYFNASNKFNEILDRAKAQHKDDYAQLLPFYNYTLEATAADSAQLDSVIYKARTGIVNHDLRNEWIDELYLLWGAAWHLQKKLDSASLMFQFINYAFAPQEEYGFYSFIGSQTEGARELSIATREEKKLLHSNTFSRNNAFIWQIRTLIELNDMTAAGSLITTLKRDPAFPNRLQNALEEVEAYWYYKQGIWDSAAVYLSAAIDGAGIKGEKARWQYLAAQLFEKTGKNEEASRLYHQVISLTPDPIMEVYARLNLVRLSKEGGESAIDRNVAELLKMAKRDKYEEYRDIIYYMAAQMEMERNNIAAANELLIKGSRYNNGNLASRSKAFLQIADLSFDQKKYVQAAAFYDSVQVADLGAAEAQRVSERKPALQKIVFNTGVINRQDSLQRIAALPQEERDAFITRLVRRLRKEQGLKEDVALTSGNVPALNNNAPTDLFSNPSKGEWYFYNSTLKAQGAAQFKQIWGNRPNVDNWRRFAVVSQQSSTQPNDIKDVMDSFTSTPTVSSGSDLSFEGLLANLPYSPEAIKASNDSIRNALHQLGVTYLNDLTDYASAIGALEEIRRRFPEAEKMDEVLFHLYYAYTKTGNTVAAAQVKKQLQERYPSSRFTAIATEGKDPQARSAVSPEATRDYERVYNLFIEGRFGEALTAKRIADSTYRTNFWQPQLLYIEAVYHIQQRKDSLAKNVLQTIVNQNTNQALTAKAQNLLSVLSRRQQIEEELNRYQMQDVQEETTAPANAQTRRLPVDTTARTATPTVPPAVKKDTVAARPVIITPPRKDTAATQPVVVERPGKDTTARQPETVTPQKDTAAAKPPRDVVVSKPPVRKPADTAARKPALPKTSFGYTFTPETAHYAVIVLDKVDPIFVSEARNAFIRYNKEKYYYQPLDVQTVNLTADIRLLLVGNFPSAQAATDYAVKSKSLAPTEIIPWLTGNKYTFTIISAPNLEVLKTQADINVYKKFLEQHLPGKF